MADTNQRAANSAATPELPGQVVLVFQGGGALGAYQLGVYQALHEAGIEPAWVIGTSIGAINGAIIAGNPPAERLPRLEAFWQLMERQAPALPGLPWLDNALSYAQTLFAGIPGFFAPNPFGALAPHWPVGVDRAAYYDTEPLRETLAGLVDFELLNSRQTRLTVGAVKVGSGAMHYFDSRSKTLGVEHVMASGALPPAFPAVRVDGEAYWDGGIFSNTPIEVVFDDRPRRDSVVFAVNMWHASGAEPASILQAMARQKDIQFASRADSHIFRQHQIHRLRHIINELGQRLPDELRKDPAVRDMLAYGCTTRMRVVRLLAPRLQDEDLSKDIDFTPAGIHARRAAGYADTQRAIARAPWTQPMPPHEGVAIYDPEQD